MKIRAARSEDLPRILEIYAPYVQETTYSFEYTVPTLEEFTDRFRRITARFPWIVLEEEGRILGYAYGSAPFSRAAYSWCCETSLYISRESRGRGLGKALCEALEDILFSQGFLKIYAIITDENTPSIEFHQAMGYRHIAHLSGCGYKLGRNVGTVWMEKNRDLDNIPSNPPTFWPEFVKHYTKLS